MIELKCTVIDKLGAESTGLGDVGRGGRVVIGEENLQMETSLKGVAPCLMLNVHVLNHSSKLYADCFLDVTLEKGRFRWAGRAG